MDKWKKYCNDADYYVLWPALEYGIAVLEKYFGKATATSMHIVNLCTSFISAPVFDAHFATTDLNPATKEEYFNTFWTVEGQIHARTVMEDVVS